MLHTLLILSALLATVGVFVYIVGADPEWHPRWPRLHLTWREDWKIWWQEESIWRWLVKKPETAHRPDLAEVWIGRLYVSWRRPTRRTWFDRML